jgi:hypothetical protein
MKTELHYYDIFPKVFPAGKEMTITINGKVCAAPKGKTILEIAQENGIEIPYNYMNVVVKEDDSISSPARIPG